MKRPNNLPHQQMKNAENVEKASKCLKCSLIYHGFCLGSFTNEMINDLFICPNCLSEEFPEEKYICPMCNEYETNRKDTLERHKTSCQKYFCAHCKKTFKNKIFLKQHQKNVAKMEKAEKLMSLVKKEEIKNLEQLITVVNLKNNEQNEIPKEEKPKQPEAKRRGTVLF